jgi:hypothetical protein
MATSTYNPIADANPATPDEKTIADAYVYLLARVLVIRQEQSDLKEPGASYNVIRYNPLGSANFVNPNFDVAYLEAWIATDDDAAVLLEVPEITGRYYTAQILDEWGEVIVNINERQLASRPFGTFALAKPGTSPQYPREATRIDLHSSKAKLLARVELKDDRDGAVALQRRFILTPFGVPAIEPPPRVPDFGNENLIGAEIFDDVDERLSNALDVSPVAAEMQQKVRAVAEFAASSSEARSSIEELLRKTVIPEFVDFAVTKSVGSRNNWNGGPSDVGRFCNNYRLRTAVNLLGIWANTSDEVIYFLASRDADDEPLDGGMSYVLHFRADQLPSSVVDSYWSVILVSVPDYRVVPNPQNRFNFNSYSSLTPESDGSLKIGIGPRLVTGVSESNWLPSAEGKPFSLTLRMYVPKAAVKSGRWFPPALVRVR